MTEYFEKFQAGEIRDQMLLSFRESLRTLVDPQTGQQPTEDLIRQVTLQGGRYWVEANDIDLMIMGVQRRDYFLGQQLDPRTASTAFLESFHGPASGLPRLPATGSQGNVSAVATPGTVFIGSTVIGDPLATRGSDPAGLRYQVFQNTVTPGSGTAQLTLVAIDTGEKTNVPIGTPIKWTNPPVGAAPLATVVSLFRGGTSAETDQQWGNRIFAARSTRPRAGNPAHFMLWARRSSNAVDGAFVFPCAQNAGSLTVTVTQKRGGTVGPLARIPNTETMINLTGYIVPPASPVVPPRAYVVAVGSRSEPSNLGLLLGLRKSSKAGWADAVPWPGSAAVPSPVVLAPTTTTFSLTTSAPLPVNNSTPELMVWHEALSVFERLNVASVTQNISDPLQYDVVLASAPSFALAVGMFVSPFTYRIAAIAAGIEAYFDALGCGEVVNLQTDMRAPRAYRRPIPDVASPAQVSSEIVEYIRDALGGNLGGSTLDFASITQPSIGSPSEGPFLLTAGKIGIYAE